MTVALIVLAALWAVSIVVFCVGWHRVRTPFRRNGSSGDRDE